jgi:3-oxoacyl-[acyl-carrier protein] reductase
MHVSSTAKGDLDLFDWVIATNLLGTFLALRLAAKQVVRGGRIIAFSSSVIVNASSGYSPLCRIQVG